MFDETCRTDHALMQDPTFAAALRLCGQNPVTLANGLTVLVQRIAGVRVAMLPRAAPPDDLAPQLCQAGLHKQPLILSPDTPQKMPFALRIHGPRSLAWLHLHPDTAQTRAQMHPKWRNQLRKAERQGIEITCESLPPDPNTTILKLETEQARARGYLNWPAPLTAAFASIAPDQTHLFTAHLNGNTIAHMLFLTHGTNATYHIGHTTPQGRKLGAHNLIFWHALLRLTKRGSRKIDLGMLDPQTPGLNHFKRGTGAVSHQTGGTYLRWTPLARA